MKGPVFQLRLLPGGFVWVRPLGRILRVDANFCGIGIRIAFRGRLRMDPLILQWIFAHDCS